MENRNFLVLDGGLGSALIRAGFDIDVSNYDTFFILLMSTNSFSVQLREIHLLCMQLSHIFLEIVSSKTATTRIFQSGVRNWSAGVSGREIQVFNPQA